LEGQVEVQRSDEPKSLCLGPTEDEVIEVSVAVEVAVIVEETPVYLILAEYPFGLTHFPPNPLKNYLDDPDPLSLAHQISHFGSTLRTKLLCQA
jgi:hypothetical protein